MKRNNKTGLSLLLIILNGCMVGPDYKPPEQTISHPWSSPDLPETFSSDTPLTDWWNVFNDQLLTKYIEMAAQHNKTILIAEANILQARALRETAAFSLFPQIAADLNATKTYFSKNGPVFAIGTASGDPNATTSSITGLPFTIQIPQIQSLYNALLDASWEIDLFGKTRRSVQAAQANFESAIEERNDTLISILAEVARNYIEVRSDQRRIELTEKNIFLLEQHEKIATGNFEAGLTNKIDYEQIQAELASTRSTLPQLVASVYRGIYGLSVLTGHLPELLVPEMLSIHPLPDVPSTIAVGIRSDVLRRRPDVRRSERNLAVAVANLGVAVASFYPSITLSADAGFQSLKIGNLFQANSKTWAVGGDINIPIFQGGQLVGNLRASRAIAEAATQSYQETILEALRDAETTLITFSQDREISKEVKKNQESHQTIVNLTRERYEKGLVNLIDVISSERQLITSEEIVLNNQTTTLIDLIALYKSLGGGWEPVKGEKTDG